MVEKAKDDALLRPHSIWRHVPWIVQAAIGLALLSIGVWFALDRPTVTLSTQRPVKVVEKTSHQTIIQRRLVYIHRYAINNLVKAYMESGRADQIYSFYDRYTGSKAITLLVVSAAVSQDIPLNLFVAMGQKESGFDPDAIDGKNRDHSKDYGLYQLNGVTFRQYTASDLLNTSTNVRLASTYLRALYDQYHSWDKALLVYNGGTINGVSEQVIGYLTDTLHLESALDEQFVAAF